MTTHQALLEMATDLAGAAGNILRDGREKGCGAVDTKSSSVDIVTEVDRASERFIVSQILLRRPEDGVLGEEGTAFDGTSGVRWIIDPLDGTVNFTYGFPFYAVSIGVEVQGHRVVGVVYNPALGEMFTAAEGEGAYLNGKRITANTEQVLGQSLVATGFSYVSDARAQEAQALLPVLPAVRDLRRSGSAALDLCSVACGRLDAYFERRVHPWDVAAGEVIAREAGALVTGLTTDVSVHDCLAANPILHGELRTLLDEAVHSATER